ncbi:hypothetical protein GCM10010428_43940 [Actinosynnema pretiosum subsp. pretiosum]
MSPPSLIGKLAPARDIYTTRPCNRAGAPQIQMPELGKVLHRYHNGGIDRW